MGKKIWILFAILLVAGLLTWLYIGGHKQDTEKRSRVNRVVPVEVAAIERGSIDLRRTFTGAVAAMAEFVVAPKVSGRIEELNVDLADTVKRGQVVARLDNDEYVQSVLQAQADLAVAKANLAEAESLLKLAARELKRIKNLRKRGVATESQLDTGQGRSIG